MRPPVRTTPIAVWSSGPVKGALANVVDRWRDGRVTDSPDVGSGAARGPTFNLADSATVVGVALLALTATRAAPEASDL